MRNFQTPRRALLAWMLLAALALILAGPAQAASISGKGVLEARDDDAMTLLVNDLVIRVTDDTRIYNDDNKLISFAQIQDPRLVESTVEYTGRRSGSEVVASKLVVYISPR